MSYEKKQRIYKTIMLVVLVAVISFISATVMMYNQMDGAEKIKYVMVGDDAKSDTLSRLQSVVSKYYLGEYDEEKMETEAAKAYIAGMGDIYSEYISAEEYDEFNTDVTGSLIGIGIYFGKTETNEMLIVEPISNSVAEKAGLLAGDIITKVDNYIVTVDSTTNDVADKIKGEVGTQVTLEVFRDGETKSFTMTRENVKLHYVETEMLENNIGYMNLVSFDADTSEEFKTKLEDLIAKGAKSLILDLRNNGGGIVQEATAIADYFLEKDKNIIVVKDKEGKEEITKTKQDKLTDLPLVVITNSQTASSAEILVSALKDNGRAQIVGIKTFGKGVIQNVYKLSDGSALKLTTHEYYTANGDKINGLGIAPNHEIQVPEGANIYTLTREEDTQLDKAIELLK